MRDPQTWLWHRFRNASVLDQRIAPGPQIARIRKSAGRRCQTFFWLFLIPVRQKRIFLLSEFGYPQQSGCVDFALVGAGLLPKWEFCPRHPMWDAGTGAFLYSGDHIWRSPGALWPSNGAWMLGLFGLRGDATALNFHPLIPRAPQHAHRRRSAIPQILRVILAPRPET